MTVIVEEASLSLIVVEASLSRSLSDSGGCDIVEEVLVLALIYRYVTLCHTLCHACLSIN